MTNVEILKQHIAICDRDGSNTFTQHVDLARSVVADLETLGVLLEAAKAVLELHSGSTNGYLGLNNDGHELYDSGQVRIVTDKLEAAIAASQPAPEDDV